MNKKTAGTALIVLVLISMFCTLFVGTLGVVKADPANPLDTIIVNSDGRAYNSTISLQAGTTYRIEASGTYNWEWPITDYKADAISITLDNWSSHGYNFYWENPDSPCTSLYMVGWNTSARDIAHVSFLLLSQSI